MAAEIAYIQSSFLGTGCSHKFEGMCICALHVKCILGCEGRTPLRSLCMLV